MAKGDQDPSFIQRGTEKLRRLSPKTAATVLGMAAVVNLAGCGDDEAPRGATAYPPMDRVEQVDSGGDTGVVEYAQEQSLEAATRIARCLATIDRSVEPINDEFEFITWGFTTNDEGFAGLPYRRQPKPRISAHDAYSPHELDLTIGRGPEEVVTLAYYTDPDRITLSRIDSPEEFVAVLKRPDIDKALDFQVAAIRPPSEGVFSIFDKQVGEGNKLTSTSYLNDVSGESVSKSTVNRLFNGPNGVDAYISEACD